MWKMVDHLLTIYLEHSTNIFLLAPAWSAFLLCSFLIKAMIWFSTEFSQNVYLHLGKGYYELALCPSCTKPSNKKYLGFHIILACIVKDPLPPPLPPIMNSCKPLISKIISVKLCEWNHTAYNLLNGCYCMQKSWSAHKAGKGWRCLLLAGSRMWTLGP